MNQQLMFTFPRDPRDFAAIVHLSGGHLTPGQLRRMWAGGHSVVLATPSITDSAPVGYIVYQTARDNEILINSLAVAIECRRTGVASQLLSFPMVHVTPPGDKRYLTMYLEEANEGGIAFLEAKNFRLVLRRPDLKAVVMQYRRRR